MSFIKNSIFGTFRDPCMDSRTRISSSFALSAWLQPGGASFLDRSQVALVLQASSSQPSTPRRRPAVKLPPRQGASLSSLWTRDFFGMALKGFHQGPPDDPFLNFNGTDCSFAQVNAVDPSWHSPRTAVVLGDSVELGFHDRRRSTISLLNQWWILKEIMITQNYRVTLSSYYCKHYKIDLIRCIERESSDMDMRKGNPTSMSWVNCFLVSSDFLHFRAQQQPNHGWGVWLHCPGNRPHGVHPLRFILSSCGEPLPEWIDLIRGMGWLLFRVNQII